jgi:hypothetical protein
LIKGSIPGASVIYSAHQKKGQLRTYKTEKEIFLADKEIQMRTFAKGFLIYEEMRKYLTHI